MLESESVKSSALEDLGIEVEAAKSLEAGLESKSQNLQKWESECWKRYLTRFLHQLFEPKPGPKTSSQHVRTRRQPEAFIIASKQGIQEEPLSRFFHSISSVPRESTAPRRETFLQKNDAADGLCRSASAKPVEKTLQPNCSVETTLPGKRLPVWPVFYLPSFPRTQVRGTLDREHYTSRQDSQREVVGHSSVAVAGLDGETLCGGGVPTH